MNIQRIEKIRRHNVNIQKRGQKRQKGEIRLSKISARTLSKDGEVLTFRFKHEFRQKRQDGAFGQSPGQKANRKAEGLFK
jgi:hypothetical protein